MEFNVLRYDEVVSTNALLKDMASAPSGTVVTAKVQTGGYGRNGRVFSSPDDGLYMSVLLDAQSINDKLFIPVRAAVAVCKALSAYAPCSIKWPNDIVAGRKKICGILAESSGDKVVLGIGVNVNTPAQFFSEHDLPYATSLFAQTGVKYSIDDVLGNIIDELDNNNDKCKVIELYKQSCITLNKEIRVIQGNSEYNAKAIDITENGELVVLKDGKNVVVNSGEVSVRGSEYV